MDNNDRENTPLGNLLQRRFHEIGMKQPGRFRSAVEFGLWLGYKQSTFSTWWSGSKVPTDSKTIDKLAAKLGVEVYDAVGVARRMPDQNELKFIASTLDKLSEAARGEVIQFIWKNLPPEYQDKWYELIKAYIAEEPGDRRRKPA